LGALEERPIFDRDGSDRREISDELRFADPNRAARMTVDIDSAEWAVGRAKSAEHVPSAHVDEWRGKLSRISRAIGLAADDAEESATLSRIESLVASLYNVAFVDLESSLDAVGSIDRRINRASEAEWMTHRLQ
jgi:hypothetical protein